MDNDDVCRRLLMLSEDDRRSCHSNGDSGNDEVLDQILAEAVYSDDCQRANVNMHQLQRDDQRH